MDSRVEKELDLLNAAAERQGIKPAEPSRPPFWVNADYNGATQRLIGSTPSGHLFYVVDLAHLTVPKQVLFIEGLRIGLQIGGAHATTEQGED